MWKLSAIRFVERTGGHVSFSLDPIRKNFAVDNLMNGFGELVLTIKVSAYSQNEIRTGRADMKRLGYDFIPSQFRRYDEPVTRNPLEGFDFGMA